ncbi:MAG: ComEC/Rec2 family competence protein [Ruminococcus sp.]|nr:ComEC/Rec2 family competence protein [Ruminococcus sp.]
MAKRKVNKKTGSLLSTIVVFVICAIWFLSEPVNDNDRKTKPLSVSNANTQVHFIDVGQGDATLVLSDGKTLLVDTGERDDSNKLLNYLEKAGIKSLDYLIITHPHSDHMGEATEVITKYKTENIIMPRTGSNVPASSIYRKFLQTVKNQNKKITAAKDCDFDFGDMTVSLFTSKRDHDDLNNYSVLIKLVHDENSFLITGDCEFEEEAEMLEQGFDLDVDVLKAGHHGSYTSSYNSFLKKVTPEYVVVSAGKDNPYGHPHDATVKRLKKYAKEYYCTIETGTVRFVSDGKGLSVETEK